MAGRITDVKPGVLCTFFKLLTRDKSAATNQHEEEINDRIMECIDGEDDTLLWDLRMNNQGKPQQYTEFLTECQKIGLKLI